MTPPPAPSSFDLLPLASARRRSSRAPSRCCPLGMGRVTMPLLAATRVHAYRFWPTPAPPLSVSAFLTAVQLQAKQSPTAPRGRKTAPTCAYSRQPIAWPGLPAPAPAPSAVRLLGSTCRFKLSNAPRKTSITPYRKIVRRGVAALPGTSVPVARWQQREIRSLGLQRIYLAKAHLVLIRLLSSA